jgi:soluble lytic murein transglycosylase
MQRYSAVFSFAFMLMVSTAASALLVPAAQAASNEELFNDARIAYKNRDDLSLERDLQQMQAQDYLLAPYADYWLMLLRLNQSDTQTVRNFLAQYADMPFADRVRGEWLKGLAKRQEWTTFFDELPALKRDDAGVSCYALEGRAIRGDSDALAEGRILWMSTAEQPANCLALYDRMQKNGALSNDLIWEKFRLLLADNKVSPAKLVAQRISTMDAAALKLLDKTYQNPQQALEKKTLSLKNRYGRELNLYALDRLARTQPLYALDMWQKLQASFEPAEQDYFWSRLALHAARRHDPAALSFYDRVPAAALDKEQMAWKARAALRVSDWSRLLNTIAEMPATQQQEAAWRYWKGRALKEQKQIPAANALLVPLSRERSYYGLLAEDELGDVLSAVPASYRPTSAEVEAVSAVPGIQRAMELQRYDMRWESRTEWAAATTGFDDKQMIAAAELAAKQEWYDLAIITADKTTSTHDFSLRYPTPYREIVRGFAKEQGLDEAWIYGLTRQESRFMHYAKSGVGASGLMQVMPATAKWIAKRMGLDNYQNTMIHQLDTNVQLGTYYMRYTLDLMGGQSLMATAAYNAGPGRARRWMADQPLEGAIYAETIPFSETRNYVQKVMGNAYYYAHRLGTKILSLKQRLGTVGGGGGVMTTEEAEN